MISARAASSARGTDWKSPSNGTKTAPRSSSASRLMTTAAAPHLRNLGSAESGPPDPSVPTSTLGCSLI
eukprot:3098998-Lingulodinium_polyedra.AAC.1